MQLDTGSVGICTAKISEAEVMFQHGIDEILMTTTNVTPTKIQARDDTERSVSDLRTGNGFSSECTPALRSCRRVFGRHVADVVIDVDPGGHRTGITPGQPALELAQLVDQLPGLRLQRPLCVMTVDLNTWKDSIAAVPRPSKDWSQPRRLSI